MKLAAGLTERFLHDNIITAEESPVVEYGIESVFRNLIGLTVTLAVGTVLGDTLAGFALWLFTFFLRINAGGFHAETKGGCLVISTVVLTAAFIFFFRPEWSGMLYVLVSTVFFGVIYRLAPVENQKKRLDAKENEVYQKRTRSVLIAEESVLILSLCFQWKSLTAVITMSFFIVGVSLLSGKRKL